MIILHVFSWQHPQGLYNSYFQWKADILRSMGNKRHVVSSFRAVPIWLSIMLCDMHIYLSLSLSLKDG